MLGTYGWDDHWSALFARFADGDIQPGRVVRHDRAAPLVATSTGLAHLPVRRNVGALTVGDWVVVDGGEVIIDHLERSSLLRRRDPGADEQLLAANVDVVAMVFRRRPPAQGGSLVPHADTDLGCGSGTAGRAHQDRSHRGRRWARHAHRPGT